MNCYISMRIRNQWIQQNNKFLLQVSWFKSHNQVDFQFKQGEVIWKNSGLKERSLDSYLLVGNPSLSSCYICHYFKWNWVRLEWALNHSKCYPNMCQTPDHLLHWNGHTAAFVFLQLFFKNNHQISNYNKLFKILRSWSTLLHFLTNLIVFL